MSESTARSRRNLRSAWRLGLVVAAMFGFGYALVPLYDIFCEVTGLGGRTGVVQAGTLPERVDESRLVTVSFDATVNSALPWELEPAQREMKVHPGRLYQTHYVARSRSGRATVGQAVPSVAPAVASKYFDKTECFCFTKQHLEAGEEREMPVHFVVSNHLPERVEALTLSYIFFDVASGS